MYINWAHYYIPKVSFCLSFTCNPIFIGLLANDRKLQFGEYRFLLLFMAIFNMVCSVADILVPVCVHDDRSAFMVFITEGPFSEVSNMGVIAISIRCGLISFTYGVLNVHFIFRYLVIVKPHYIKLYFLPHGLILSVIYCTLHLIAWAVTCYIFMYPTQEFRTYVSQSLFEAYQGNSTEISFLGALFQEASTEIIIKSWAGILILTSISMYSITLYFVLGYKIFNELSNRIAQKSLRTIQMQRQLFKALTVQTVIPICISFMPCVASFYGAAFSIGFPQCVYWISAVTISTFAFLDPLAITFFLPTLRVRLRSTLRIGTVTTTSA